MKDAILEYTNAVEAYIKAVQVESSAKVKVMNCRARLQKAKQEMRAMEFELLEINDY